MQQPLGWVNNNDSLILKLQFIIGKLSFIVSTNDFGAGIHLFVETLQCDFLC